MASDAMCASWCAQGCIKAGLACHGWCPSWLQGSCGNKSCQRGRELPGDLAWVRISTLFLKENGVLQQQWLATTCFWAEVLGCEVVVGTLEKRLSHFARPSTYHGPIGSCPKTAKNRQNPKWHTEMAKWGPKSVGTPKQPGSVQPSAWHSAHTC